MLRSWALVSGQCVMTKGAIELGEIVHRIDAMLLTPACGCVLTGEPGPKMKVI
jgi:hypothetical protein